MTKHRIMIVGDSPYLDTGFSLIVRDLSKTFYEEGYEVRNIGLWDPRPNEMIMSYGKYSFPWPVHICKPPFARYAHGPYIDIINEFQPTVVIIITDIWHAHHFMNNPVPSLYYFHVEGGPMPETSLASENMTINWPEILLRNKKVVLAGPFGQDVVFDRMARYIKKKGLDIKIEQLKQDWPVIPDGIDLATYTPLPDKESCKAALGRKPDDFIIGFFSRMNARKGLPYAIEAFANWPNRPENAYFYCHCAMKDRDGWNLEQLIEDYGLEDKIIVNPKLKVGQGVRVEELNKLYNACDVVVSPSLGEGFGQTTCLTPGAFVKTKRGYIDITEVKEGDEIATHLGRYRKVLKIWKSMYNGSVVKITPEGAPAFYATMSHRILAKKRSLKESNRNFGYQAYELKPGDILKYPVIKEDADDKIKELLEDKPYICSEDKGLIFKYRDILLGSGSPNKNGIMKVGKSWKLRVFKHKYPYSLSHHKNIKGEVKYVLSNIRGVKVTKYKGLVYNMHVDQDASFLVNGVTAVHNCQALAAGTPVIITDYSELQQFTKGTLKLKPIAFYVDTVTNIKRAIPAVEDITKCYQQVYNKEVEHLRAEARDGVSHFDWNKVKKMWIDTVESVPVQTPEETMKYTPNLDKWIYEDKEPNDMPVSIIICNKEKLNLLQQCVDSIKKHTTGQFEVIIHDTGSTSPEVKKYLEILSASPNFRIFRSRQQQFNFSVANNSVAKYARYDTLVFLNNDTIVNPNWISEMKKIIQDERVGIVGAKLIFGNRTLQHAGVMIGNNGIAGHVYIGKPFDFAPANYTREVSAVTGACLMIRKDVFEKIGKFDPKYLVEFQDVDLCLKAREAGYKVIYAHNAVVYHLAAQTRGQSVPVHEAMNDRPLFVNRWMELLLKGDPYTPVMYNNPNNHLLLEYWAKPPMGEK